MNRTPRGVLLAAVILLSSAIVCSGAQSQNERLQITQSGGNYELGVPVGGLTMAIPKGGLAQKSVDIGGSTNNPRYFLFEDKDLQLVISGWFEPEQSFPGMQKFWENETKAWARKGLPEPQNVTFSKIGGWDAINYDNQLPKGSNSHIRAHWLQAGTWIDIHLSMTSERPSAELRSQLQTLLKAIQVKVKQ